MSQTTTEVVNTNVADLDVNTTHIIPFDKPNPSYKVELGIPVDCAKYRIVLENNVSTFDCRSVLTIKLLQKKDVSQIIDRSNKLVKFSTNFNTDEYHIFNLVLDNADISIEDLFVALDKAVKYFELYEVSRKSQSLIDRYINNIGRYTKTWQGLTSKPDYNLTLFRCRTLPYFNLECKDWVKANLDSLSKDYPSELTEDGGKAINDKPINSKHTSAGHPSNGLSRTGTTDEFSEEMSLTVRNNNFLDWQILPIDKYPNMEQFINYVEIMLSIGLKRQALTAILRSMLSPKDCHIIREPRVWAILKPELTNKDFNELTRYCMYYAMYILKQEETIMFSQVNTKARVLFTIEQAAELPQFALSHIDRTPYIVQLTDNTALGQTMPFYLHGKRYINTKAEFERRFNIATGGAFKGVNLRELGAAITGSILIPCVQKSPLEEGFDDVDWNRGRSFEVKYPYMVDTPKTQEDFAFANYLEYYYPSYASLNDKEFKEQVLNDKSDTLPSSLMATNTLLYEDEIVFVPANFGGVPGVESNVEPTVTTTVEPTVETTKYKRSKKSTIKSAPEPVLSKPSLDDTEVKVDEGTSNIPSTIIDDTTANPIDPTKLSPVENKSMPNAEYNQLADIDVSITTRDHEVFKERALKLYNAICENCKHRGPVYIKEVKTIASIKYKLYGPGLPRPMDIFRIPYDPIKMVKKFHIHAVKMFYDGDVVLFRSCVVCLLSGVGETYKWFSCNKVPADVLLKYAQRGFSVILNSNERSAISNYISGHSRWGPMLEKINMSSNEIYCCVNSRHPFFRPGLYSSGIRMGLRNFERDASNVYPNILVVTTPKQVFSYGEVITHDNKKIYPPNIRLIGAVLDNIEYGDDIDVIEDVIHGPGTNDSNDPLNE